MKKAYIQFGNGSQAVFEFVCKHSDGFLFKDSGNKTFTFNNGKLSINNGDLKADRIEIFQRGIKILVILLAMEVVLILIIMQILSQMRLM